MFRKSLRLMCILLLAGSTVAQSSERRLHGYWVTNGNNRDSSLLFNQDKIISQSFYFFDSRHFQRQIIVQSPDHGSDTLIYNSRFRQIRKKGRLQVSNDNQILRNRPGLLVVDKFSSAIRFTSENEFTLLNNAYTRVDAAPALAGTDPKPRRQRFQLENTVKSSRRVRIPSQKIQMQVDESSLPGEHLSRFTTTECILDSLASDSLSVTLLSEETEIEHRNKFVSLSTNYYSGSFSKVTKKIAVRDILYLNMRNQFRQTLFNTGSCIMAVSILAIVASPFCGLQLKGDDRAAVRNRVFSAGLSGFAVSLPFFIIGKNRKYGLSPAFRTSKNNYWKISGQ